MTVTVITSEISREEEEDLTSAKTQTIVGGKVDKKLPLPVSKSKPFEKVAKHRHKPPSKRDKNQGKKRSKNSH